MSLIERDLCMADPPAACHCGRCVLRSRLTNREVAELEAEVERLSTTTQGAVEDAQALAHAVSASLTHGEQSPLADALKAYLERHPWSDL